MGLKVGQDFVLKGNWEIWKFGNLEIGADS